MWSSADVQQLNIRVANNVYLAAWVQFVTHGAELYMESYFKPLVISIGCTYINSGNYPRSACFFEPFVF